MLRPDVLADLERFAAAGSFRPEEVARLQHFTLPVRVAVGHRVPLSWDTTDCQQVVLRVPGLAPIELAPEGEYWIDADIIGRWPIQLELWSDNDLACGLAGHIEERTLDVVARPVHISSNQSRIHAPVGSIVRVSWVISGAVSAFVRTDGERLDVPTAGSLALTMPALAEEILLCALGDDGVEHHWRWQLQPQLAQRPSYPTLGTLYESLEEMGQLHTG